MRNHLQLLAFAWEESLSWEDTQAPSSWLHPAFVFGKEVQMCILVAPRNFSLYHQHQFCQRKESEEPEFGHFHSRRKRKVVGIGNIADR